jgi:hypothetical protein
MEAGCLHAGNGAMKKLSTVALLCVFAVAAPRLNGSQRLAIRVTPAVALAPAVLTIRATIEPSDDNRRLNIEIDSSTYHRSSEIPLDGKNSQRLNVVELKGLPTGLYEVKAVLVGASGPIANSMQLVKVEPSAGNTR